MTTVNDGGTETVALAAGEQLTVVSVTGAGRIVTGAGFATVAAGATSLIGPFSTPTVHRLEALDGPLTYSVAPADFPTAAESLAAASAAAAAADFAIIGTIGDLCEIIGEGAPAATAQATLLVNPAGDDNALTFTAVAYGTAGHAVTIEYVDPAVNDAELAVSVSGSAITVSLATDSDGIITSTAAEVKAAVDALPAAAALATVAVATADSGTEDDGSGIVTAMASAPLAGGTGVGIGVAGIGSRYTDVTNGKLYLNSGAGTKAVPVWKIVTSA